jgi:glycosyltransferase involved in cell wall biosynthesis
VVSHHGRYRRPDGSIAWQDRLKRRLLRHAAASISVSRAVAEDLETPSVVVENSYDDTRFRPLQGVARDRELLFVGRLVSDKGCIDLIEALARMRHRPARLTVVGDGPEAPSLRRESARLGLEDRVRFVGQVTGEALVEAYNRHRVAVVPSRYNEPFGIVALEAMACGCLVVGSEGGGLVDAIGPGGWTFPNGDPEALAGILDAVLDGRLAPPDPDTVREHLARHSRAAVASAYLDILDRTLEADRATPR